MEIDLNALKRARAEQNGETHTLLWGEYRFELPHELPLEFSDAAQANDVRGLITATLGETQAEQFFTVPDVTLQDAEAFLEEITKLYTGRSRGESSASARSSRRTSPASRQPSSGSTT
jgi:hypothetical protein